MPGKIARIDGSIGSCWVSVLVASCTLSGCGTVSYLASTCLNPRLAIDLALSHIGAMSGTCNRFRTIFSLVDGEDEAVQLRGGLGTGTLSRVDAAEWLGMPVAIKQLRRNHEIIDHSTREQSVSDFENEASVNEALGFHPNIVGYLGRCRLASAPKTGSCSFGLVFERINGSGSLDVSSCGGGAGMTRTLSVALCVARGLAYAHGRGFMHRDVKPSNVLLTRHGIAKLCDWGLAVEVAKLHKSGDTGTNEYMAYVLASH